MGKIEIVHLPEFKGKSNVTGAIVDRDIDKLVKLFDWGEYHNVRELDIGMTITYPLVENSQIKLDQNGKPIPVTDTWVSGYSEPIDAAHYLHFVGTRAEYIFTYLDMPEDDLNVEKSFLMKSYQDGDRKYGIFKDDLGDVIVRPHFVGFQYQDGHTIYWITNDKEDHTPFTDQYIMVVKEFTNN